VHAENEDPASIINPAKFNAISSNETCLNCHDGQRFDFWEASGHKNGDVSCASCHVIHAEIGQTQTKTGTDLCYSCHNDVRVQALMPSHHPIIEGKMDCSDCHNPHGGLADMAMFDNSKELCFSCHAEKEGPFVFEHEPVVEDCMVCHTPHGSVADNLLVANEPILCLNCHAMHFHATITGDPDDFAVPDRPDRAGVSTLDGWKKGMLTKCTTCHTAVHGSDLPSQSISGQGGALTR
jgi:DmsE family decaheme c-type cytochrome